MYSSLISCIDDLRQTGQLIDIEEEVDPYLEMAEIHRRVYRSSGPAVHYKNIKGSKFSAVSNLFGTSSRVQFLFRDTLKPLELLTRLKTDPKTFISNPLQWPGLCKILWNIIPKKKGNRGDDWIEGDISMLPHIVSWPKDGGAFITLPQVYTEDPEKPGWRHSNLGMYRIQISGGEYEAGKQVGLHYQIHRGIGHHHTAALEKKQPLKVSIFIGGPPGHTLAAVMPMPEGIPEIGFAGAISGRRFSYTHRDGFLLNEAADFCITGTVSPGVVKPEGPFGDHLGYYSLKHDYPVLEIHKVYYKKNSIWPFTVVGRPPQEDTEFGRLIHQITGSLVKNEIPGVKEIHAVDASGVHPLMLAVAKERYVPWQKKKPMEILTAANAILGYGQCSLAKYLFITADDPLSRPSTKDVEKFFSHCLKRIDFENDLHFITRTTMDTLDYSGESINSGSKLIAACAGTERRDLSGDLPQNLNLAAGFSKPVCPAPGILCITGPGYESREKGERDMDKFCDFYSDSGSFESLPLIVVVDDSDFTGISFENFLWVTFTRSNPASDVYGIRSFSIHKHWGCKGPLVIDARIKPHHAAVLEEDKNVLKKIAGMTVLKNII